MLHPSVPKALKTIFQLHLPALDRAPFENLPILSLEPVRMQSVGEHEQWDRREWVGQWLDFYVLFNKYITHIVCPPYRQIQSLF